MRRTAVTASLVAVVLAPVLALSGCAGQQAGAAPVNVRLADIQSHTLHVHLHQVIDIHLGRGPARFTPEIADLDIVSVVERRSRTGGRFEPEIVPLSVGSTQVALIGADPNDSVGFRVIVSP